MASKMIEEPAECQVGVSPLLGFLFLMGFLRSLGFGQPRVETRSRRGAALAGRSAPLQEVIQFLKGQDYDLELKFGNYR